MTKSEPVAVICGGVGAARLLRGFVGRIDAEHLTAIANVGDDMVLHGLNISPDLDTIVYTLADAVSAERGWGLEGETWQAMEMIGAYGAVSGEPLDWFSLGDRDLGTHLFRTGALAQGSTLDQVTAQIAAKWELPLSILPVTNDPIRTMVTLAEGDEAGTEISFQEYFVGRQHSVAVSSVRFDGAASAQAGPGVLEAIDAATTIVVAPSNPAVSIDPVLAVPGVRERLEARRGDVVGVSPIIGGKALKGPADRLLVELGRESSATAVAEWYRDVVGTLVIDTVDADQAPAIEALGVRAVVTDTIMSSPAITSALAETILAERV